MIEKMLRLHQLPKAEIHLHLEGCFDKNCLIHWSDADNIALPKPADELLDFNGLGDFLAFLDWACHLASTSDRIVELAYACSKRIHRDGTGYADIIINPTHWKAWHGRLPDLIDALDAGFSYSEQEGLPPVGLCISLLRNQTSEQAIELVNMLIDLHHPRVKALSIDGNEALSGRTGARFAEAFSLAGKAGLKRTVHAGESSGPEGVRDAIQLLEADRIDHGVRAIEDSATIQLLVDRQIPLGICPTSNVSLGLYSNIGDHPIEKLRQHGVLVSVNSDDPALLETTLVNEYDLCQQTFNWSDQTIYQVAKTSIQASFATESIRTILIDRLNKWIMN